MRIAWAACVAASICTPAVAQNQIDRQVDWSVGVAPVHRTLTERGTGGARLLTERGTLARIDAKAQPRSWDRRLQLRAAVTTGRLDYAGRTQSGIPLNTTTRHQEAELGASWRALEAPGWGNLWVGADWLRLRRAVTAAPGASALTETSSLVMPTLSWTSPALAVGGVELQADARLRATAAHRLRVHFGGVFDDTAIHGGRRNEASIGVSALLAPDWQLGLSLSRALQKASDPMTLSRSGTWVGTVQQPDLRIDDVSLRLSRSF